MFSFFSVGWQSSKKSKLMSSVITIDTQTWGWGEWGLEGGGGVARAGVSKSQG